MSASESASTPPAAPPSTPSGAPEQRYDKDYAYGKYDEKYYETLVKNEERRSHQWRLRWVDLCLDPKPGDRIADLGCGAGAVSKHLAEKGAEVHGVDLSETGIEDAKAINA